MDIKMKLDPEKLRQIAAGIGAELLAFAKEVKGARGVLGIFKLLPKAVELIEKAKADHKLLGADAKEIAVAAVLLAVPDRWVPDEWIRPLVSWGIERAYQAYKRSGQKSGL